MNMNTTEQAAAKQRGAAAERLPCRGCTRDCPNYNRCDGRPWSQFLVAAGTSAASS